MSTVAATPVPRVLFQDARFVVIDKPAGLAVHAGPGTTSSVEDMFPLLSRRREGPWLAHRLDADTAGCLVIALRKSALLAAQGEFAAGRAEKVYWAVVRGWPAADSGVMDSPLAKVAWRHGWRMAVDAAGQTAVTEWRVLGQCDELSWLELRPKTGRTHQVRVHCAALGCPLVGDSIYGGQAETAPLHLLARSITLRIDPVVAAVAAPPFHMEGALRALGFEG